MSTLEEVLSATRLTSYADQLNENGCELSDLIDHDTQEDLDSTLQELGITTFIHRRRLQRKIWEIKTANNNNNNNNNENNNNNNQNNNNNNRDDNNNNRNNNNNNDDELTRMLRENQLLRARLERERLEREEEARQAREREEQQQQLMQQRQRQFEAFGIDDVISTTTTTNNNNNKFAVQFDQGDSTFVKPGFEKSDTGKTLYKAYAKYIYGQDSDSLLSRFELTFSGTTITTDDWNTSLESLGMGTNPRVGDTVSVVMLVNGGTTISRTVRENQGYVVVEGECCILKMVDKCAKMEPCGHLISAFAMYMYIKSVVTKNEYAYQIVCPVSNCGKLWDWNKCCNVGDLKQEEYMSYTRIVRRRQQLATGAFKDCPHCKILIKRPDTLGKNRLQCGKCKNKDFCYICLKTWKASGFTLCGNEQCPLYEKQKKLLNCPKIQKDSKHSYDYYRTLDIPIYRACPKCYRFIKHQAACKHMCCPGCGLSFCFICLGLYNKQTGKWPCMLNGKNTSHTLGCNLAPRQKLG